MAPNKQIHMNFFDMACTGSHMGIGEWKNPKDNSRTKDTIEYYTNLAKLAEKGKLTSIFFADTYAVHDTYEGKADASFRGGHAAGQLDPVVMASAMTAVTKSVSVGITGSTTYIPPYLLARTWGTLDHMSKGRVAWNIVTSYSNNAAKAMGQDKVTPHDKRYIEADEYMDIIYSFWEGSWEDGAQLWSPEKGAYDPKKIHKITFNGKYHKTSAHCQSHPSPQRTPVLFQAGSSGAGKKFAARHAEVIFCAGDKPSDLVDLVKEVRAMAVKEGRNATDINFFPSLAPIVGRTLEEAQAKYKIALEYADWEGGLACVSGFSGLDLSVFPLDEPFDFEKASTFSDNSVHTMIEAVKRFITPTMTPRQLGKEFAFCGFGAMPVGTPDMIADEIEEWINVADIDGFIVSYVSNPQSYEDFVELLVPVLQERGIMWKDYAVPGGTFRENLRRAPGEKNLPQNHIASQFRYDVLKNKYADENGDIVIDRMKEAEELSEVTKQVDELKVKP
ncbi:bacterial luciferase-like protein [Coleophoma cylindrospora]|uniref:Bacterial luciferase-like protein n=1 Tax=Coleophoma cylindrospora TaxID=1849047 RepID=A0A3D8RL96_9HELO|nr:bacterial luciferase-like protein [Coleophoma cylindrospora]